MKRMRWQWLGLAALIAAVPVAADEMQDAMARADALNLMLQIGVLPSQAQQMIGPLRRIREAVDAHEAAQLNRLNQLSASLQRARAELVAGNELSPEMASAIDGYEAARQSARLELYRAVSEQMQIMASVLTPEQNRYLDWTPPGIIQPEACVEERLRMQQVAMGRIQDTAQMLDAVKHLHTFNFVTGRGPLVNDYLARYFPLDAAQFQQAYVTAINYTDQVRMLTEEQWQAQSMDIAAAMVEDLGLMPSMDPGLQAGTIPWSSLFELVTHPQTLVAMRGLAQ